jgi:peptidoglycan/LPS O-acetylase OafA/YrhL
MTGASKPEKKYIPAIDGLRAVAVTLVLAFHSYLLPVGWVGVWVFFVISGFVITGSLLSSEAEPRPLKTALADFYSKRFFRIIPLYALILVLATIVHLSTGVLGDQLGPQLLSLVTFTFNFFRMWPGYTDSGMTGHLWSLSVEEQFYFIFPLLFLLTPRKNLLSVMIGVIVASVAIRWGMSILYSGLHSGKPWVPDDMFHGASIYMFSPGHFDAFAMGAMMAILKPLIARTKWVFTGLVAATLAGWAIFFIGPASTFESPLLALKDNASGNGVEIWRYSLLGLTASCAVVGVIRGVALVTWPLSLKPVVYVGKISYGVYIYHLPVQVFLMFVVFPGMDLQSTGNAMIMFAAELALTVAVASLSFYFFERPMQKLKPKARAASLGALAETRA